MASDMKKSVKVVLILVASFLIATTVLAANVELYSLDGRTLSVKEEEVSLYTAEGMGWYLEKPVTMYSVDGRTIVVPADRVQAHKEVGWFLKGELDKDADNDKNDTETPVTEPEKPAVDKNAGKVFIKYTDGTVVRVPADQVKMYEALGWVLVDGEDSSSDTVIMYDANGNSKEVPVSEVGEYTMEGWTTQRPDEKYITVYLYDGSEKSIPASQLENYKLQGWYPAYDEAVYAYAAFGVGDTPGATKLIEEKKYEMAFNMVQDALDKIENTDSEYISMLHYLRSTVTDTWREAAKSPLGFINYWFSEKDGNDLIVFEYRNVSNSRIQSFRINFEICDKNGNVIERNSRSYFVDNLQMTPCDKKRVAWAIKTGDSAKSITNLKVLEVVFSDGTKWTKSN